MRATYVIYWLSGFVIIAAIVFWLVNTLLPSPAVTKIENSNAEVVDHRDQNSVNRSENAEDKANNGVNDFGGFQTIRPGENTEGKELNQARQENALKDDKDQEPTAKSEQNNDALMQTISPEAEDKLADKLAEKEAKRQKLKAIRDELKEMITSDPKNMDVAKLDGLLEELQSLGDEKGTLGGVSIGQLRKVLAQSNKIIQTSQNQGLQPGEDKNAKLKEEVETLKTLQNGILVEQ